MSNSSSPDLPPALPYRLKPGLGHPSLEKDGDHAAGSESKSSIPDLSHASQLPKSLTADTETRRFGTRIKPPSENNSTSDMAPQTYFKRKDNKREKLRRVAIETQRKIPYIITANMDKCPRHARLLVLKTTPFLATTHPYYPALVSKVKVVRQDTFDAALNLQDAHEILGSADAKPVCALNLANAFNIGGGWKNGAMAQEEELCYRSTLSETLPSRYYPMKPDECIYSSTVIIFRENYTKGHSYMWTSKPETLPVLSVISMAATNGPKLHPEDELQYEDASERILMERKMRLILRTAGYYHHRRLVLGALGCGAFHHPAQEVARCWKRVLQEEEFKGWFEMILFAVLDKPDGVNYTTFRAILHDLAI